MRAQTARRLLILALPAVVLLNTGCPEAGVVEPQLSVALTISGEAGPTEVNVLVKGDGSTEVSQVGICVDTAPNPGLSTRSDNLVCEVLAQPQGTTLRELFLKAEGLRPSTTYYARGLARIASSGSVFYSSQATFQTASFTPAALVTSPPTGVTATGAALGGTLSATGNSAITEWGVCYATTPAPTRTNSCLQAALTAGGGFSLSVTGLSAGTRYYARAFATNSAGTAYGNEVTFLTESGSLACPAVQDVDGNSYNSVRIAERCWTQTNLRTTRYRNGDLIPLDDSGGTTGIAGGTTWSARTTGSRTVYANNATNLAIYGYLYNGYTVRDPRGVCPAGWRVPTFPEWDALRTALGGRNVAGAAMKATTGWRFNTGSTNQSGLTLLPAGIRGTQLFNGLGQLTDLWSSTLREGNEDLLTLSVADNSPEALNAIGPLNIGASIRCTQN